MTKKMKMMASTMRKKIAAVAALALMLGAGATSNAADVVLPVVSGEADRKGVEITIYNQGMGIVKDRRALDLKVGGTSKVLFMDVASQVVPSSVRMRSLLSGDDLAVLEQNYEYDLLSPTRLLEKYVGRKVKVREVNQQTGFEEIKEAEVLSYNDGQPVLRIDNAVTFGWGGNFLFPEVPKDLIARPTLTWLAETEKAGKRDVEALYMTNGMSWRADYVMVLDAKDASAGFTGWVTLDNRSGASFRDAKLKLVAGDVNRVQDESDAVPMALGAVTMKASRAEPQFREQALFEYHLYTLQRSTDVMNNQSKQVGLLSADAVPTTKEYQFFGGVGYYRNQQTGEIARNQKIPVFVSFKNDKASRLGIPLPKGVVRVYKADDEGTLQFVGENRIDHTPKDETVKLKLGDAFDVVGSRKQTAWKVVSSNVYEAAYAVTIRNHKTEKVTVRVIEPIPGDWQMLEQSLPHEKEDSRTAVFKVPVHPDSETTLTYRVRMRFF